MLSFCHGVTKSGRRCSITSASNCCDSTGKLAREPLRYGRSHCTFHQTFFHVKRAVVKDATIIYLDFATSGLSVIDDNIVEVGLSSQDNHAFAIVIRSEALKR